MKSFFAALALVAAASITSPSEAKADGFKCHTVAGDLAIKVYNHTHSASGTRNAATMVLSDATVRHGRKTIAVFRSEDGLLQQSGATYVAKVDLRFTESRRSGENVGGTKLGQLAEIGVAVDFLYTQPVEDGALLAGKLHLLKRNGEVLTHDLVCERYLKN